MTKLFIKQIKDSISAIMSHKSPLPIEPSTDLYKRHPMQLEAYQESHHITFSRM